MKKSFLRVSMMLMMASVTLTSCQDFWDDVFGEESTPSTPTTPSEPEDDTTLTKTETGAEATVSDIADITNLLDDVKDDIAEKAKSGEEYVFEIKNEGLETTTTDNVIEVPKVEGSNINLNFTNGVSTETTLVVKAAETASETPTEAVDELTITMPATTTGLNLELDMPETTVTLKAASGEVVYDEVIATTAINTLHIEKGVTAKNLRVKGGRVKVKDGGKAETYVYAATNNDTLFVGNKRTPTVQDKDGNPYHFKNLKIIKGTADYANVDFQGADLIEKLILAEGVAVKAPTDIELLVKVIEAEGTGAELIIAPNFYSNFIDGEKEGLQTFIRLSRVTKIEGVSLSVVLATEEMKELFAAADTTAIGIDEAPGDLVNCTFKCDFVNFGESNVGTGSIKDCTFEMAKNGYSYIAVPPQSDEMPSYKLNFTNCNFSEGYKFWTNVSDKQYVYDENGNRTFWTYWEYWDENSGRYRRVGSESEIPEGVYAGGPYSGYKTIDVELEDYYVTISFSNCTLGGNKFPNTPDFIRSSAVAKGAYLRYEIDGTLYELAWDSTKNEEVLSPVQ